MMITTYFSQNGAPKTGLSPLVDIRDVSDGSLIVDDGAMVEVGSGWYRYDFSAALGYDPDTDFVFTCDGTNTLSISERYAAGSTAQMGLTTQVEGSLTVAHILKIMLSWMTGLSSGGGSDLVRTRDYINSKDRIQMFSDEHGNRSRVTLDGS